LKKTLKEIQAILRQEKYSRGTKMFIRKRHFETVEKERNPSNLKKLNR